MNELRVISSYERIFSIYELGIVEQSRDAARGCGQDVGTVCGSFPAPVSVISNVNQRD